MVLDAFSAKVSAARSKSLTSAPRKCTTPFKALCARVLLERRPPTRGIDEGARRRARSCLVAAAPSATGRRFSQLLQARYSIQGAGVIRCVGARRAERRDGGDDTQPSISAFDSRVAAAGTPSCRRDFAAPADLLREPAVVARPIAGSPPATRGKTASGHQRRSRRCPCLVGSALDSGPSREPLLRAARWHGDATAAIVPGFAKCRARSTRQRRGAGTDVSSH